MCPVNHAVPLAEFFPASQPPPCYINEFNVSRDETSQCICVMGVPCLRPTGDQGRYLAARIVKPIFYVRLVQRHEATLRHHAEMIDAYSRIL
jgi:hypothetical protein